MLVGAGVIWRQHRELQTLRAQADTIVVHARALPPLRHWTAQVGRSSSPAASPILTTSPARAFTGSDASFLDGPETAPTPADAAADRAFLRNLTLHQHARLDATFAALFRQLDLSPDELQRLKRLLVDKLNVDLDVLAYVQRAPADVSLSPAETHAAATLARREIDSAIRATLGDERFEVFQAYEAALPARLLVARVETRLSYSDEPLSPDQTEALVSAIKPPVNHPASAAPAAPSPPSAPASPAATTAPVVTDLPAAVSADTLDAVARVLSPRQLEAFVAVSNEEAAGAALRQATAGAALGQSPGAGVVTPPSSLDPLEIASFILLQ